VIAWATTQRVDHPESELSCCIDGRKEANFVDLSEYHITFGEIVEADIQALTSVMTRAFDDDAGGKVIGGIIVWILPEGHSILGTIFVDPDMQDKGVGALAWRFIEESYPETVSWRLATPTWATKNHHFYTKCGFSKVESDPLIPAEEDIAIYRKEMAGQSRTL
jgi:GNAT superfamily N-acetyltransferase